MQKKEITAVRNNNRALSTYACKTKYFVLDDAIMFSGQAPLLHFLILTAPPPSSTCTHPNQLSNGNSNAIVITDLV